MRPLITGLYAEGRSDERFLPELIARTVRRILNSRERYTVDVVTPEIVPVSSSEASGEAERILTAASKCAGYDMLFVHLDADAPSCETALTHRFQPGVRRVQAAPAGICRNLVPIIPVREIEAWMLADLDTLVRIINPVISSAQIRRDASPDVRLPERAHEVEANLDPKRTIKQIIGIALSHRRRSRRTVAPDDLQVQLGASTRLNILDNVPSYAQFVTDLTEVLIHIGFAKADHEM